MKRYQNDIFQKEKKESIENFNNLNYSSSEPKKANNNNSKLSLY